jgi:peptidoglycan hydrolase-like protein with peptidoglycan-binding domain
MVDFKFNGPRLDSLDFIAIGGRIGVGEDIIHGVMDVETGGSGTDSKGRLKQLYEPHVAYRCAPTKAIRDKLVAAGLAYPKWRKGYPKDSYPRLLAASKIDPTTALKACSWALPQILGENFALAGYPTVEAMVEDFTRDEDNQLEAMINFIKNAGLDDELRVMERKIRAGQKITPDDARPFVRGYNGTGYERNNYHVKLANAINKWAKIPDTVASGPVVSKPALTNFPLDYKNGKKHDQLMEVQLKLDKNGYPEVGAADGKWGDKTATAVMAFRLVNKLPTVPDIDDDFLKTLAFAQPRPVSEGRAKATLSDLRKEDVPEVKDADQSQVVGTVLTAGGAVVGGSSYLDTAERAGGIVGRAAEIIAPFQQFIVDNFWLLAIGGGAFVIWKSGVLKRIRLEKHQTAADVSR